MSAPSPLINFSTTSGPAAFNFPTLTTASFPLGPISIKFLIVGSVMFLTAITGITASSVELEIAFESLYCSPFQLTHLAALSDPV